MPLDCGFFAYCRRLGRGLEDYKIGLAMMTDVPGDRDHDQLYLMIPIDSKQAKKIERAILVIKSSERIVEFGIDRVSQDKI